jgi:hypothetical protein
MDSTFDTELVIGFRKREWKDKSGNVITSLKKGDTIFNIKDCILSWYLLSFEMTSVDERFNLCWIQKFKSTLPFDTVAELLNTPVGGDEGIPMSLYDCQADCEDTSYAYTYYDIFKYFDTTHKIIFYNNPVPWNPIEIWKYKTNKLVDGIPADEITDIDGVCRDIGLRWHSINNIFFHDEPYDDKPCNSVDNPTFTKCLTFGYGRN